MFPPLTSFDMGVPEVSCLCPKPSRGSSGFAQQQVAVFPRAITMRTCEASLCAVSGNLHTWVRQGIQNWFVLFMMHFVPVMLQKS